MLLYCFSRHFGIVRSTHHRCRHENWRELFVRRSFVRLYTHYISDECGAARRCVFCSLYTHLFVRSLFWNRRTHSNIDQLSSCSLYLFFWEGNNGIWAYTSRVWLDIVLTEEKKSQSLYLSFPLIRSVAIRKNKLRWLFTRARVKVKKHKFCMRFQRTHSHFECVRRKTTKEQAQYSTEE